MRIFAKIRQVYDRRKEASADRMRQEREQAAAKFDTLSGQAKMERQPAVERDSKLLGFDFGHGA